VEGAQHEAKMAIASLEEAEAEAEAARRAEDTAVEVAQARSQADRARYKAKKVLAELVEMWTQAAAARHVEEKALEEAARDRRKTARGTKRRRRLPHWRRCGLKQQPRDARNRRQSGRGTGCA
jgi:hypothetical protein